MPAPAENPHHYGLYGAEGPKRFLVKLTVDGITVSDSGLTWINAGTTRQMAFSDIAAIHLGAGLIGNSTLDTCRLTFSDGNGLVTADWNVRGLPDDKQLPIYRAFVHDLHARLVAQPTGAIRFSAGLPQWRYNVVLGGAIVFGLMWIAALITVLFVAPGFSGFGVVAAGAFLLIPVIKLLRNAKPQAYTPDSLPEALLS